MRIFLIRSPAVHVQLHRRPGLPLEVAGIHHEVLATENTVHVGCDVRLSGKPGADISRDVETDIFPLSACLVARPDSGITLRAGPTVERDDERTCVVSVIRHDMSDISHTVQTERVAPTDPCHVCFQDSYTGISYLLYNVALQQGSDAVFRMQVGLCPKTDFDTVLMSVIGEAL